jgi:serine/threonine-protein kinase
MAITSMQVSADTGDGELAAGTDVSGYIIESKIGEGGMGRVYGAQHPRIGKRVAIKVLGPQFCRDASTVARFEQEARLVSDVNHSNIVEVYQLGDLPDGRKYMVMEWLEGESLSDRIERGPMPPAEALMVLDAICDALESVHEKGIVHRDLKSDNVFLARGRNGVHVKLLDFGLAKLAGNDPRAITKTKTGIIVGTPHYMAPEQARGKPVDHRTDVYALGVLSYKMLTGKLPFVGQPIELLVHHLKTPPPSPGAAVPGIPDGLSNLVMGMMAKMPEQRPTLGVMRQWCESLRNGGKAPAPSDAPASGKRPAWVFVAIALAVAIAAVMSFVVVRAAMG